EMDQSFQKMIVKETVTITHIELSLIQILDNEAQEKLTRISIVKAEKARTVEDLLIRIARSGQLRGKVNESQLIDLLQKPEKKIM
ncbi:16890_t:CDS:2, partial [Gigaspora margarita]